MSLKEVAIYVAESKALAIPAETLKTFWKVASAPIVPVVRNFVEGFREAYAGKKGHPRGDVFSAVKHAYAKAFFWDDMVPIFSGLFSVFTPIAAVKVGAPLLLGASASGLAKIGVAAAIYVAAAPLSFLILPVAGVALATAACTLAASVWSMPYGGFKGFCRMLSPAKYRPLPKLFSFENPFKGQKNAAAPVPLKSLREEALPEKKALPAANLTASAFTASAVKEPLQKDAEIAALQERLASMQKEIDEIKNPKPQYIDKGAIGLKGEK